MPLPADFNGKQKANSALRKSVMAVWQLQSKSVQMVQQFLVWIFSGYIRLR